MSNTLPVTEHLILLKLSSSHGVVTTVISSSVFDKGRVTEPASCWLTFSMKYITASNILHNKNNISINIFSEKELLTVICYSIWHDVWIFLAVKNYAKFVSVLKGKPYISLYWTLYNPLINKNSNTYDYTINSVQPSICSTCKIHIPLCILVSQTWSRLSVIIPKYAGCLILYICNTGKTNYVKLRFSALAICHEMICSKWEGKLSF